MLKEDQELRSRENVRPIWEIIQEISREAPPGTWDNVPTDGSVNHDHYLYGAPKQEPCSRYSPIRGELGATLQHKAPGQRKKYIRLPVRMLIRRWRCRVAASKRAFSANHLRARRDRQAPGA